MLEQLLAADPGHRGPRVPYGSGDEAEFISCRDKTTGTVLGPVTLTRAWYHCEACKHGFAPRDAELGVAGTSLSPGLMAMNDQAAAAGPFAKAAVLLEGLLRLSTSHLIASSAFSRRSRISSVRSSSLSRPSPPSRCRRSLATQFSSVPGTIPSSRATCAIGLPVSRTSRTAPSLNPGRTSCASLPSPLLT